MIIINDNQAKADVDDHHDNPDYHHYYHHDHLTGREREVEEGFSD